jgi:hypothetical protein
MAPVKIAVENVGLGMAGGRDINPDLAMTFGVTGSIRDQQIVVNTIVSILSTSVHPNPDPEAFIADDRVVSNRVVACGLRLES